MWPLATYCCPPETTRSYSLHTTFTNTQHIKREGKENHDRVVSGATAFYSGGPGFEYRPGWPAIISEGFHGFPQSLHV
jgi:hypothetical protein